MIFPASNLSTAAQPWGRVVEKSIGNLETLVATERVNNAARDAQAVVNIKRLDESVVGLALQQTLTAQNVAAIQTITDAVFVAGTTEIDGFNIKAGTINASSINAGTLTGFTVQTASTGQRVVMGGSQLSFYDSVNNFAGSIYGSDWSGGASVTMTSGNGSGIISAYNGGAYLGDTTAYFQVINDLCYIGASEFRSNASTNSFYNPVTARSSVSVWGGLSTDSTLTRTALATGASTTCTINGSGQFVRTTSSERYKQDIQGLSVDYDELMSLEPKRFRLKEEVAGYGNDARYYAGLIAEELDQLESLRDFVGYEKLEDGTSRPDSVYYGELSAALLSAVKHQDSLIKDLSARIVALENK